MANCRQTHRTLQLWRQQRTELRSTVEPVIAPPPCTPRSIHPHTRSCLQTVSSACAPPSWLCMHLLHPVALRPSAEPASLAAQAHCSLASSQPRSASQQCSLSSHSPLMFANRRSKMWHPSIAFTRAHACAHMCTCMHARCIHVSSSRSPDSTTSSCSG